MAKIEFGMGFKLDKRGLKEAQNEIKRIKEGLDKGLSLKVDGEEIKKLKKDVDTFEKAMDRAFDKDLGKINISKFNSELKKSNMTVEDLGRKLKAAGISGTETFMGLQKEVLKTGVEVKKAKGFVADMAESIGRTAKWAVSTAAVNGFTREISKAVHYVKGMDESLNNIRIVTGKSAAEMEVFEKSAQRAAGALGKTTKEYSDASLIFFQQGKTAAEVRELTEATLVGANITGQSVTQTADNLTAVMNGYTLEASKAMEVTDKLAAVGAATGSDFGELAIGMSKVASAANVMGVPMDKLNGMLATVSTVTREAPETIGTTFKTIFTRVAEMKAGKGDEEGWTTGKVEEALQKIGVSILDENNKMRDMGDVIEEVGNKWATLNKESKVGVATAMAGTRQSSRLIALYDNWSMYQDAVRVSEEANGTAMEQNAVRLDTISAKTQQFKNEMNELYNLLTDPDMFKGFIDFGTGAISMLNDFIKGLGGLENLLYIVGGAAVNVFGKQISEGLVNMTDKITSKFKEVKDFVKEGPKDNKEQFNDIERQAINSVQDDVDSGRVSAEVAGIDLQTIEKRAALRRGEEVVQRNLTESEFKEYQALKDSLSVKYEELNAIQKKRQLETESLAAEKEAAANDLKAAQFDDEEIANLEKTLALEREIKAEKEGQFNKQSQQQKIIGDLIQDEEFSYNSMEELMIKTNNELTTRERKLKDILAAHGLTEDSLGDYISEEGEANALAERLAEIYGEITEEVEDMAGELDKVDQNIMNMETLQMEAPEISRQEMDLTDEIRQQEEVAKAIEMQAGKVEKVQATIEGLGAAMQLIGTIKIFTQLGDESLTASEKTNIVKSGMIALSGVLMGMVPVLGTLATAFGWTWAAALGPIAIGVALFAGVTAGLIGIVQELDPVNQAIERNNELLEKQNKTLAESKQRLTDLRGTASALKEIQNEMSNGIGADGQISYASVGDLNTEEYEKYIALSNQVASVAPEMVKYYDEQGNAILDLTKDYDTLIEKEKEHIRVANEAKLNNQKSFATQYQQELEDARHTIAEKQKIIDGISKSETGTYGGYDSSDISVLSAEITELNNGIKETQGNIATNIIDPIYSSSEAYSKLTAKNQEYVRGLMDADRVSQKLNDPEKLAAYTGVVTTFINEMSTKNQETVNQIKAIEEEMRALEVDGVSTEESAHYQDLQEQLKAVKETVTVVSEEFDKLNEVEKQGVMEMASLYEIKEGQLSSVLDKLAQVNSAEGMTNFLNTGGDTSEVVQETMSAAGYEAPPTDEEYDIGYAKSEQIQQEIEAIEALRVAHLELEEQKRSGLEVDAELQVQSDEFLARQGELSELQDQLYEQNAANLEMKVEQAIYEEQARELEEQQTEAMWNQVDALLETTEGYNQLADAYNTSIQQTGDMTAEVEKLDDIMRQSSETQGEINYDDIAKSLENYKDKIPGLSDALNEMGQNGESGLKKVRDAMNKTADAQGKLYAKMKGQDTAYWAEFQRKNNHQTSLIEYEYGIRADQYSNYQEYEKAIANLTERDKIRYVDQGTRERIKKMSDEELAQWKAQNAMALNSYESYKKQAQNGHESAKAQGLSFNQLKKAGLTTSQAVAVMGAQMLDSLLNSASGMINGCIGGVNYAIRAVNKFMDGVVQKWNGFMELLNKIPGVNLNTGHTAWQIPEIPAFTGSNLAGNLFDKFQSNNMADDGPDFDFNYGGDGGNIPHKNPGLNDGGSSGNRFDGGPSSGGTSGPSAKPSGGGSGGKKPGGSGGKKPGKGSGGSGGKGESEKEEKEVEDLEWEKDIYHDINVELEKNETILSRLKDQQKKLYGKELLDNLAKQKQALKDQQNLLEQKLALQKQDLANQKSALANQGVQFNVDGTISNYNKLLAEKVAYVNSLSGEAKEAAKKEFDELTKQLKAYEDMLLNTVEETQNKIQKAIDEQREIYLQELDYAIELKIEISGDYNKALDFVKEMNDEYEDMSENYERTQQQIKEQTDLIGRLAKKIEETRNNQELTEKERLERLEEYTDELQKAVKELDKMDKELTKIFKDTLKDGLEIVEEHSKQFDILNDQLDHYADILKLIGEGDNYQLIDDLYESQYENVMAQIDIANKTMDSLKEQQAAMKAAGLEGTEEWKALDKAINDTQKDLNKLAKESLNLLKKEFKNSMDEITSGLEKMLSGGKGFKKLKDDFKDFKEERKKYLDGEEKLLAISKLQNKVQKELDLTTDPAKRKELEAFMNSELKSLKEKDRLTKYDVDRANQVYDLTLKQMALEDQRAAKNVMRLVRDTQGNWVYEFTEDAKAIQKAQEDVSSSMEKLMDLDKKNLEKTQEEMIKLQEEYYKEVERITKDAAAGKYATEDELKIALQEASDKYNEKMKIANDEYEQAKLNTSISSMGVIIAEYQKTGTTLDGMTEAQKDLLDKLAKETGGSYNELRNTISNLLSKDPDSIQKELEKLGYNTSQEMEGAKDGFDKLMTDMKKGWSDGTAELIQFINGFKEANDEDLKVVDQTWLDTVKNMKEQFAGEGGFEEITKNAMSNIMAKWEEYKTKVGEVQTQTGTTTEAIKNGINEASKETEALKGKTDELISKFEEEFAAVTKLTIAYNSNKEAIENNRQAVQKLIDDMVKYIESVNKAIDAIKRKNDTEDEANKPKPTPPPQPPKPTPPPANNGGGAGSGGGSGSGGTQGNGKVDKGDKVKVKYDNAAAWYTSTGIEVAPWHKQARAVGKQWNDDFYVYNTSNNRVALSKAPGEMALAWLKQSDLQGFDTGGYTGDWNSTNGKLAMLHEKEIVLNKHDTAKILEAVQLVRGISGNALTGIAEVIAEASKRTIAALGGMTSSFNTGSFSKNSGSQEIQQNIEINADFSGVKNSQEIEKAFENMANMASQYVSRR